LRDGIVLSHLVGYITCSYTDRQMIFDLLAYPTQGPVDLGKARENFDLAFNVLKHSQLYQENPKLQFLNSDQVNPDSLCQGMHLVEFLQGLQDLAFCSKQRQPDQQPDTADLALFNNSSVDSAVPLQMPAHPKEIFKQPPPTNTLDYEEDEMARLEREEQELLMELENVDKTVNHMRSVQVYTETEMESQRDV